MAWRIRRNGQLAKAVWRIAHVRRAQQSDGGGSGIMVARMAAAAGVEKQRHREQSGALMARMRMASYPATRNQRGALASYGSVMALARKAAPHHQRHQRA